MTDLHRLRAAGRPDPTGRHLLVAVGSNRAPEVIAAKLAGVPGSVLMTPSRVTGLGVGHSAHVSRRGYLAAAPFDDPDRTVDVTLLWVGDEQLAALDATEPNYDRVVLDPDRYAIAPNRQAALEIYATRHRLIAPAGALLPLVSQTELQQLLLSRPTIRDLLAHTKPGPDLCDRLAQDDIRAQLTALLPRELGVRPAGLMIRGGPQNQVIGSIS